MCCPSSLRLGQSRRDTIEQLEERGGDTELDTHTHTQKGKRRRGGLLTLIEWTGLDYFESAASFSSSTTTIDCQSPPVRLEHQPHHSQVIDRTRYTLSPPPTTELSVSMFVCVCVCVLDNKLDTAGKWEGDFGVCVCAKEIFKLCAPVVWCER